MQIVGAAAAGIRQIYKPGFSLAKAGVMLLELQPASRVQHELALDESRSHNERLMETLDALNDRYGRGTLSVASAGAAHRAKAWTMKQDRRTPAYTTRWEDIPTVRA